MIHNASRRHDRKALLLVVVLTVAIPISSAQRPQGDSDPLALLRTGRYAEAVGPLRRVHQARPTPESGYFLGFALLQTYAFVEAQDLLSQAVAARPKQHGWRFALAQAIQEQANDRAAIEVIDRCLKDADLPQYRFGRAACNMNLGRLAAAEADLRIVVKERPKDAQGLYKLGVVISDRGDFAGSREFFRRSLAVEGTNVDARFRLGLAHSKGGNQTIALTSFDAVLATVPGHVGALYAKGRLLARIGKRKEARAILTRFREFSVLEDRIHALEVTIKIAPDNLRQRIDATRLMLKAGRVTDARTHLTAAQRLGPAVPEVYDLMTDFHEMTGNAAEAAQTRAHAARLRGQKR